MEPPSRSPGRLRTMRVQGWRVVRPDRIKHLPPARARCRGTPPNGTPVGVTTDDILQGILFLLGVAVFARLLREVLER